jgi:arylformamidase
MRTYDISVTISPDLPTWPGDPGVDVRRVEKIEDGSNANVSRMDMGVHTGTHVDAPEFTYRSRLCTPFTGS